MNYGKPTHKLKPPPMPEGRKPLPDKHQMTPEALRWVREQVVAGKTWKHICHVLLPRTDGTRRAISRSRYTEIRETLLHDYKKIGKGKYRRYRLPEVPPPDEDELTMEDFGL